MKKLVNLKGAKILSKTQQKSMNGGTNGVMHECEVDNDCSYPYLCQGCFCILPGEPV